MYYTFSDKSASHLLYHPCPPSQCSSLCCVGRDWPAEEIWNVFSKCLCREEEEKSGRNK